MDKPISRTNYEISLRLHDKDIFPNTQIIEDIIWKDRVTGKAVLFDDKGNIALIGNQINDLFMLPGGGIHDNEEIISGIERECREETGYEIKTLESLGVTEDFRSRDIKHYISFGYSATIVSVGVPSPSKEETSIKTYVKWLPISEVAQLFAMQEDMVRRGEVHFYNTCFNIIRDAFFIRQAMKILGH